jgi:hypothetical protein
MKYFNLFSLHPLKNGGKVKSGSLREKASVIFVDDIYTSSRSFVQGCGRISTQQNQENVNIMGRKKEASA